ncbi:methyltransferase domain-containing protein [Streptomyces sp. N2-109]|uniref:Methyltransferase domain-containing protein n=1 Tax=Streptomyces gossypii TaxID=2883101 RepID=A0ABT2JNI8_9ACTN|nr:methyltransferase domain-containing protein [Streptomyces gossypii]MCT2589454.1 methyltransferase domain-containing protein [Streptomyces gossypii]
MSDDSRGPQSAVYTHGHHDSVLRSHRWRTAANSAAYLLPELRAGQAVLDVGCGPGTVTADLAAAVAPGGEVTGVDAAESILGPARAVAAERRLDNLRFTTADVHALDFPDDTFDVVHAHQLLQHVGDPVRALEEMRRVCRPGGVLAARDSDYGAMTWYPRIPALDEWLSLYRRVARANGGEPDAGRRLHAWARRAGCAPRTVTTATWCFHSPEDRAWWSGLWAERTVASEYARRAVGGGHADEAQLHRIADGWREWGADEDGWFSVLHGEIVCDVG